MASSFRFMCGRLLPSQFVLQDQCHDDTHNADDQAAEEGIPPNRVADGQSDTERLTNDARQPEQEGVDDEGEQTKCQDDQRAGKEFEQGAE